MVEKDERARISVIVPVYGTEKYLNRCIESLLHQSYKNLEIIIVNDGSPGNPSEIIGKYTDPRIHFIDNQENQGLLRARICGSLQATGKYIAFVDSDDYVSSDFYRTLLTRAVETDSDIVIGKTVWQKSDEKYIYNFHESSLAFDTLEGEALQHAFFDQELQCYSWHTVWNKLYKKSLWDSCLPYFQSIDSHIVMTEDIFFSSLLFFHAKKAARVENDAYFYCVNEEASTNSENLSFQRFAKNMADMQTVFDSTERCLRSAGAEAYIIRALRAGRQHYARMWGNFAVHHFHEENENRQAKELLDTFCTDKGTQSVDEDYFFEKITTPWNGGLEYIKEQIQSSSQEYISFDVFDTLVLRPFYEPADLLQLLDLPFTEKTGSLISFSTLRMEAEEYARSLFAEKLHAEDVTMEEIYQIIVEEYKVSRTVADEMMQLEKANEIRFCRPRKAGVELFQLAQASGKKIVLITDMYLDRSTIETILHGCGIKGWDELLISSEERCLKYNGRLFLRALSRLGIRPNQLLHIGDGWKSDIEGSRQVGVSSIFFPKPTEIFENKIAGCTTNLCADLGKNAAGDFLDYAAAKKNPGFRCMQALVADWYFDNPYRTFHPQSDLNIDPCFIGYYVLGMHLSGLILWLHNCIGEMKPEELYFLSRDGWLLKKAYESAEMDNIPARYILTSRRALMPVTLDSTLDLYQMPIEYRAHSPATILSILDFMTKEEAGRECREEMEKEGKNAENVFSTLQEYQKFIHTYIIRWYDVSKHESAKKLVKTYYGSLSEKGLAFDMGYSGRIQASLCQASGRKIDAVFLHEDYQTSGRMKRSRHFRIRAFYPGRPEISGLVREYLFSGQEGSCIGFREASGSVVPVREQYQASYPERFTVARMQDFALQFVDRFFSWFKEYPLVMEYSPQEVSLPFEGFLRQPGEADLHVFSASYSEDLVFGAREKINIEQFFRQDLTARGWRVEKEKEARDKKPEVVMVPAEISPQDMKILNTVNKSAQWKRGIMWLLMDKKFFVKKLKNFFHRRL